MSKSRCSSAQIVHQSDPLYVLGTVCKGLQAAAKKERKKREWPRWSLFSFRGIQLEVAGNPHNYIRFNLAVRFVQIN